MIVDSISADEYKSVFNRKFRNFGDKSPVMISYTTDELGVQVVHVNSGTVYSYDWDYTVPVGSLIHRIKQDLMVHYPRIQREESIQIELTPQEQADMMASGTAADKLPSFRTETRLVTYRLDKAMVMRDEVILVDEGTDRSFCYSLPSTMYFLKKYREGKFSSMLDAGEDFFRRAKFMKETTRRN